MRKATTFGANIKPDKTMCGSNFVVTISSTAPNIALFFILTCSCLLRQMNLLNFYLLYIMFTFVSVCQLYSKINPHDTYAVSEERIFFIDFLFYIPIFFLDIYRYSMPNALIFI